MTSFAIPTRDWTHGTRLVGRPLSVFSLAFGVFPSITVDLRVYKADNTKTPTLVSMRGPR